jgi:HSP20 family molecular chaperone IbpA
MSDKDKIKNASNNVIDLMSKFGKQFLSEAIDHGEPIIDLIHTFANGESKARDTDDKCNFPKSDKVIINDDIIYLGPDNVFKDIVENERSFTVLFTLAGVNRQDLILEKNDTSLEVLCKTSISNSRILGFKYKEDKVEFILKFTFRIESLNILAELKDGLLKIDIEKPHSDTDDELITLV